MSSQEQELGEAKVEEYQQALGPFVVAAEMTRMAIAFTHAGTSHGVIFANDSFLKLIGYRRNEVIGQPLSGLLAGRTDPIVPDLTDGLFRGSTEPVNIECHRKDGGRVSVELRITPVYDEHGSCSQYFVSLTDLTAQVKWQRVQQNASYSLYQRMPDFVAITESSTHRFTFVNAAYQEMVGERTLIGNPIIQALPELAEQAILTHRDQVYRTGNAFVGTGIAVKLQRVPGADVELRYLDFIYQPIETVDGTVTGVFCEGHDVTEQKALEDRVKSLQIDLVHLTRLSAMGTMAATLAHEMTQPLTAIASYAAVCSHLNSKEGDNREDMARALKAMGEAVSRGGDVIHRLQALTERRKSPRNQFRLKEAIHESIALVRTSGYENALIVDCSSGSIKLNGDRTQIQQVLINLLRNGCEALGSLRGRVTVSTATKQDKAIVTISDTGEGVSQEASKSLFQWADSTKPHGTGIGLSICRTIVEAHGGSLWLEETGHTGSCFVFSLPLSTNSDAVAALASRS